MMELTQKQKEIIRLVYGHERATDMVNNAFLEMSLECIKYYEGLEMDIFKYLYKYDQENRKELDKEDYDFYLENNYI